MAKNVILSVIECLRADHLGCYGYHRNTSPWIDQQAHQGLVFEHGTSQSTATLASVASIFTSQVPSEHGVFHAQGFKRYISEQTPLVTEVLNKSGIKTAGFVGNIILGKNKCSMERGFDTYPDNFHPSTENPEMDK